MAVSQINPSNATASLSAQVASLAAERQRLAEALALAERDRQLVGYEIHDGIVQDLTAAALLFEAAGKQATFPSADAKQSFESGVRLLQECIAEARRLIGGLASVPALEESLTEGLQKLIARVQSDQGLLVSVVCEAGDVAWTPLSQHLVLRIVQEALHNAARHARAQRAEVRLARHGDQIELVITDDGVGFDPSCVAPGHFGLDGMRERARILRAALTIDSRAEEGTRIIVRWTPP
jgi:signal transduction histidine kinase